MYLINAQATYKNMDFILLEKFTALDENFVIKKFENIAKEILILKTCNRFELYIVPENGKINSVLDAIKSLGNFNIVYDKDAIIHVIEVAAGMDSMIPGEQDIQRQVKESLNKYMELKKSGKILNYIFMRSLNISKKIRTDTRISNGIVSIPQSSVKILESMMDHGSVMVIGTGRVANSLIKYLKNNYDITVFGRNEEKLKEMVNRFNVNVNLIKNIKNELKNFDALFSAVSVSEPILFKNDFIDRKPNIVIDLGNPRNIEKLEDRYYIDLEYIKNFVNMNITQRKKELEKARKIINERIDSIEEKVKNMEIENIISEMYQNAEKIIDSEIEESVKILGESSRPVLEKMKNSLIKKIYSNIVENLRNESNEMNAEKIEFLKRILR